MTRQDQGDVSLYLEPGEIIRSEDPRVKAQALFYWVRDQIRYNPYSPFYLPEHYWPVRILERGEGYCVQKSALLVGLARAQDIPARLIFADIINHRVSDKLYEYMGTKVFAFHGYVEFYLQGGWVRVNPAFEEELCETLEIYPVEFDGQNDALFHRLDRHGQVHVEYLRHHGTYADVPLQEILAGWERTYTRERLEAWKASFSE